MAKKLSRTAQQRLLNDAHYGKRDERGRVVGLRKPGPRFQNIKMGVRKDIPLSKYDFDKKVGENMLGQDILVRDILRNGNFYGQEHTEFGTTNAFSASLPLFLIREAWGRGCNFEDLADGYGEGMGTHGDWSGIRDSSDEATEAMFERAMNFLFPVQQR